MTVVQLTTNLRIWYDRYATELSATSNKSSAEREAEEVICTASLEDTGRILVRSRAASDLHSAQDILPLLSRLVSAEVQ